MGLTLEPRIVEWLIEQTGRAHPHDEPPAVCGACAVYNYLSEKWRIAHLSRPPDEPVPPLDVERLAATEWAYDTMPESFDMIRDPVEVWNDRLYPASDDDKDRYRVRAVRILSRSEPEEVNDD